MRISYTWAGFNYHATELADLINMDADSVPDDKRAIRDHFSNLRIPALCVLPVLDEIFADTELKAMLRKHKDFDLAVMRINHGY